MEKHAAYCGTSNILPDMETAAKSLIVNSDVDKIWFVTDGGKPSDDLPDMIEIIDVSDQTFFPPDGANMKSKYTYMAMMRIALCHVLPDEVHRVLSLDHDTFAVSDVSAVWDLPIDDCYLAATPEWHRSKNGLQYCNFGVVLYNLDKMRDGKADECIEVLNRRRFPWVEQCVGNYLCQGRIYEMPARYNDNYWTTKGVCDDPAIVHYAGEPYDKWHTKSTPELYRSLPWQGVMRQHRRRCCA